MANGAESPVGEPRARKKRRPQEMGRALGYMGRASRFRVTAYSIARPIGEGPLG